MVFQSLGRDERAEIEAVHACHLYDTLTLDEVSACHVVSLLVATVYADVVAVADTCAEHLILPVYIAAAILQCDIVLLCIGTELVGCTHVVCVEDVIESHVAIV